MKHVAKIMSAAPIGFEGQAVEVECDIKNGLPSIQIVGLGSKAVDEAKERVRSAITNSHLDFPTKKIVINLAPAELPKDGALYDLPIAVAILASAGLLKSHEISGALFAGELALDGTVRPVKGAISVAEVAKKHKSSGLFIPKANVSQAQLVEDIDIYAVANLKELYLHLKGEQQLSPIERALHTEHCEREGTRLDDIFGQEQAKRAAVISAAGRHNILLNGPPGSGKTMLATTLRSLLPPLSNTEILETTKLHSLSGESVNIVDKRPFRAPHHTASRIAMIGGGTKPKPGEVSLAHRGILFLDEMPEYPRNVLESLRQPLEDNMVSIARAEGRFDFPAEFTLVGTMNPCPCGYYGDSAKECSCTSTQILAYQKRLSGPLLDRIDLNVTVAKVPISHLSSQNSNTYSQHKTAIGRIQIAIDRQNNRYRNSIIRNASLSSNSVKRHLAISTQAKHLLDKASDAMQLSARSYFKIIKVARTIADLSVDEYAEIEQQHIAEALQYRFTTS